MARLLTTLVIATLTACGGGKTQSAAPKAEPAAAPVGDAPPAADPAPAGDAAPAADPAPTPAPAAEAEGPRTSSQIAEIFFRMLNEGKYDVATAMFHYPPSYSDKELADDKRIIGDWLRVVTEELGQVSNARPPAPSVKILQTGVGSGNDAYWKDKGAPVNLIVEVDFAKEGVGYVTLGFSHIDSMVQLRYVVYGLAESHPNAKERLEAIEAKGIPAASI